MFLELLRKTTNPESEKQIQNIPGQAHPFDRSEATILNNHGFKFIEPS